jgi:hypothetical protein
VTGGIHHTREQDQALFQLHYGVGSEHADQGYWDSKDHHVADKTQARVRNIDDTPGHAGEIGELRLPLIRPETRDGEAVENAEEYLRDVCRGHEDEAGLDADQEDMVVVAEALVKCETRYAADEECSGVYQVRNEIIHLCGVGLFVGHDILNVLDVSTGPHFEKFYTEADKGDVDNLFENCKST